LFLKITGHFGSSILIKIANIINTGNNNTKKQIEKQISNILLIIVFFQDNVVFHISSAGKPFIKDIVVFVLAKSNELAIYLYLTQKIIDNSHKSKSSSFEKLLETYKISSSLLFFINFCNSTNDFFLFIRYFIPNIFETQIIL
jgi:hypothetical protein